MPTWGCEVAAHPGIDVCTSEMKFIVGSPQTLTQATLEKKRTLLRDSNSTYSMYTYC